MASTYDITFLRLLMQRQLAEKPQAMRCLQVIDQQAQRGQSITALQVVVQLGLVDADKAREFDALAREEIQKGTLTNSQISSSTASQLLPRIVPAAANQQQSESGSRAPPPPPPLPNVPPPAPPLPQPATRTPLPGPAPTTRTPLPGPSPLPGLKTAPPLPGQRPVPAMAPGFDTVPPRYFEQAAQAIQQARLKGAIPAAMPAPPPPLPGAGTGLARAPAPLPPPPPGPPPPHAGDIGELTATGVQGPLDVAAGGLAPGEWYDLAVNGEGLSEFESGAKVGRGPVGTTYAGRRKQDGAPVVVKVLSRRFDQHQSLLDDVLKDLEQWRSFRHPCAAALLAVGMSNERRVLVYEKARGEPLDQLLRANGPFKPAQALRAIYDVASALAAAQRGAGVSLGDVRDAKVFWDGQRAQVVDLGQARASCLASGFGQHGLSFGHPAYLAPEVMQERLVRPTPAADVYALGILAYQLLCGVLPFQGEPKEILRQHFDAPLPKPPPNVTFNTKVAALILRMTAKAPGQRLATPEAVVSAINLLLGGAPPEPALRGGPQTMAPLTADEWGRESAKNKGAERWSEARIDKPAEVEFEIANVSDLGAMSGAGRTSGSVTGRLPLELLEPVGLSQTEGMKLGERVGRGSVGSAYEATVAGFPGPVVVKVISKKYATHADLLTRILERVKATVGFKHPNVVAALKVQNAAGRELVVFEKVQGGRSLRQMLEATGPLRPSVATRHVMEIAQALEVAQSRRSTFHGDLRPEKVLVDAAGKARVADFGLAEASCLGGGFGKLGLRFGHPEYLAPEVVQESKKEPDLKTDVYALGCLYYELICGRPPFRGATPKETLVQHLKAPLPPPPDDVSVPGVVAQLILKMTSKDPAKRLGSWTEVLAGLKRCENLDSSTVGELGSGEIGSEDLLVSAKYTPVVDSGTGLGGGASGAGPASASGAGPSSDGPINLDEWEATSASLARPSGEWDKNRIDAAPPVGPEEWSPDQVMEEESQDDPLAALIKAAAPPSDGELPQPAHATAPKGATATRTSVKGKAATVAGKAATAAPAKPAGKGKKQKGDKKGLITAVGGLVLVVGLMIGGVILFSGGEEKVLPPPNPENGNNGGQPPPPPPPPVEDPNKAKAIKAAKVLREDVDAEVRRSELKRARELVEKFGKEHLAYPEAVKDHAAAEAQVSAAVDKKLEQERGEVNRLKDARQYDAARRKVEEIAQWLPGDRAPLASLRDSIDQAYKDYVAPVQNYTGDPAIKATALREKLKARLAGWKDDTPLFDNGGFVLRYRGGEAGLDKDLKPTEGPACEAMGGGVRLRAISKDKPLLAGLDLPLKQVYDVRARLRLVGAKPGDSVSLLVGVGDKQRARAVGVDWGQVPSELNERQQRFKPIKLGSAAPTLPDGNSEFTIYLVSENGKTISGNMELDGKPPHVAPAQGSIDTQGRVAVYVSGSAEVILLSLEVRGQLDLGLIK